MENIQTDVSVQRVKREAVVNENQIKRKLNVTFLLPSQLPRVSYIFTTSFHLVTEKTDIAALGSVHWYSFVCISFVKSLRVKFKSLLILHGYHKKLCRKVV